MTQPTPRASARSPRGAATATVSRSTTGDRCGVLFAVALAVLVSVSGCSPVLSNWLETPATPIAPATSAPAKPTAEPTPAPPAEATEAAAPVVTDEMSALSVLETLPVKGRAPKTGYDREGGFGTAWLDVDRNGCDTRNDILARDLIAAVRPSNGCRVGSGTLLSPYSGEPIEFLRGNDTSTLVQIDHLVSLSNAWQTGAQQLSQERRTALANDPVNLLAVDQRSNAQKGDGDAATWLPANRSFRCPYVARQVSVKAAYRLWVTEAEKNAMQSVLATCADERVIASPFAPMATDAPAPPAYDSCDAARAAGAAPIRVGDQGYGPHLDRDGNGIGCE